MLGLLAELNQLGPVDIGFFVAIAVIIGLAVGIYFLIPVINKKQYQEQRDNLKKREVAFKSNLKSDSVNNDSAETENETADKQTK